MSRQTCPASRTRTTSRWVALLLRWPGCSSFVGAALLQACYPAQTWLEHLLWPCCHCYKDAAQDAAGRLFAQLLHPCLLLVAKGLPRQRSCCQMPVCKPACCVVPLPPCTAAFLLPHLLSAFHLQVNVDGHALTLSVQQQNASDKEEETGGVKWHCMERSSQFIQRVIPLPDSADVKDIKVGVWWTGLRCLPAGCWDELPGCWLL